MSVVDLYAGAGGWDLAANSLGFDPLGIELDADACATRKAADLRTLCADVAACDPADFAPLDGLIGSPPCQSFSSAGKQLGCDDMEHVYECMHHLASGRDDREALGALCADPRSLLVVEPLRWALALRPRWVALEQVPGVLPIWERMAWHLEGVGYATWTGVLNSADFGVPQTRQRAILMASLDCTPSAPPPTHADARRGIPMGYLPWVSMADALGWGMSERPSPTVVSRNEGGGVRPLDGGSGTRALNASEQARGAWRRQFDRRCQTNGVPVPVVEDDRPAPTITAAGLSTGWDVWRFKQTNQDKAATRTLDEQAETVVSGNGAWPEWTRERPATTVQGDPRIGRPGHKDREQGESQFARDAVRVSLAEASVLQDFPPDYPWQGGRTAQFRQVGNAIPPALALAVLGALTQSGRAAHERPRPGSIGASR